MHKYVYIVRYIYIYPAKWLIRNTKADQIQALSQVRICRPPSLSFAPIFISAHCASSIKMGAKLRREGSAYPELGKSLKFINVWINADVARLPKATFTLRHYSVRLLNVTGKFRLPFGRLCQSTNIYSLKKQ